MEMWEVNVAQAQVSVKKALNAPLPGWIVELAKVPFDDLPSGSVAEFRRNLPDTVPEFVEYEPWKRPSRWKFWRNW